MLVGQLNVSPGVGHILAHGDDRTDTGCCCIMKNLAAICVKRGITDVGVGVYEFMSRNDHKAQG